MRKRDGQDSIEAAFGFFRLFQLRPGDAFAIQQFPVFTLLAKQRFGNLDHGFVGSLIQQGIDALEQSSRIFFSSGQTHQNL